MMENLNIAIVLENSLGIKLFLRIDLEVWISDSEFM